VIPISLNVAELFIPAVRYEIGILVPYYFLDGGERAPYNQLNRQVVEQNLIPQD
jgi:hypothetical protein